MPSRSIIAACASSLLLAAAPAQTQAPARVEALMATRVVAKGETLLDLARASHLGYVAMLAANPGVDPWLPKPGTVLRLPARHLPPDAPQRGLVVNLAEMRLYRYPPGGGATESYPVGVGREGWELTPGTTSVVGKRRNPAWVPPPSIRAETPGLPAYVPPGPDNPMGAYALDLGRSGVRIHGTNVPDAVGRRASHGCLRMYPEDIEALFAQVQVGTAVTLVDQAAKAAWVDDALWLEVHPTPQQADALEARRKRPPAPADEVMALVARVAADRIGLVDWNLVRWAAEMRMGIAIRVSAAASPNIVTPGLDPGVHAWRAPPYGWP